MCRINERVYFIDNHERRVHGFLFCFRFLFDVEGVKLKDKSAFYKRIHAFKLYFMRSTHKIVNFLPFFFSNPHTTLNIL